MVLQSLTGILYQVIQNSWILSTVLVKWFLLGFATRSLIRKDSVEVFQEELLNYSRLFVSFIILLGFLNVLAGIKIQPVLEGLSQVTALLYFGFLFWKY